MLLPRTPAPRATESLWGYTLRLSETNGYDSPWHMLSYAGFSQREMKTAGFPVEKLAALLGRKASALSGIAYCADDPGGRYFKILSHSFGPSLNQHPLRLNKPAFCPQCVEEHGYLDALWDLTAAVACPIHRVQLLSTCPSCHGPLRWFRRGLLTCSCGANLSGKGLEGIDVPLGELMSVLHAKLEGRSVLGLSSSAGFPLDALEDVPLTSFINLASALGRHSAFGLKHRRKDSSQLSVMMAAADVLADWPHGYHALVGRMGDSFKCQSQSARGLQSRFERFYALMCKAGSGPGKTNVFQEEFNRVYPNVFGPLLEAGKDHWQKIPPGGTPQTILRVKNKAEISDPVQPASAPYDKQIVGAREAAARVGLPVAVLVALVGSEHLAVRPLPRHKRGLHAADVDALRTKILHRSTLVSQVTVHSEERIMSLQFIMQRTKFWSKEGKVGFIEAYLDGHIRSLGRIGDTLNDVLFRQTDVHAYAGMSRAETSGGAISQSEAATILGCDLATTPGLIDTGHLIQCLGPNRVRVERASAESFAARYVSLASIAKSLNTTASRLLVYVVTQS